MSWEKYMILHLEIIQFVIIISQMVKFVKLKLKSIIGIDDIVNHQVLI